MSRSNLDISESIPALSESDKSFEKPSSVMSPRSVHRSGMKFVNRPVEQRASLRSFVAEARLGARVSPDTDVPKKRRLLTVSRRDDEEPPNRFDQKLFS